MHRLHFLLAAFLVASCGADGGASGGASGGATSAAEEPRASGPRLAFERTEHDFGTVSDVRPLRAEFPFRNAGSSELAVEHLKASCGCTAAELERKTFAPGEGDVVEVEWEPKGFGTQSQTVQVTSNDARGRLAVLTVRANVEPLFRLSPPRLDLGHVRLLGEHEARIVVRSERSDVELVRATSPSPHVAATVRMGAEAGEPGAHSVVGVTLLGTAPKGRFFTSLRLQFAGPGLSEDGDDAGVHAMEASVSATVYELVRAEPNLFAVGLVPPGGTVRRTIRLEQDSGEPFGIAYVETSLPVDGVEVEPRPCEEDGRHGVDLVLEGPVGSYTGSLGGTVRVVTDLPAESPLTFPVLGRVGGAP